MDSVVEMSPRGAGGKAADAAAPLTLGASLALDQWRGLALLLVLAAHGFALTNRAWGLGRIGVNLFFFISGILVFRSLVPGIGDSPRKWAVSFWRRRLRRLLPAFLVYVAAMIPVVALMEGPDGLAHFGWSLPYTLTFTANYPVGIHLSQHHLWSLCCELQFYLLAPFLFLAGGTRPLRRVAVWGGILAATVVLGLLPSLVGPIRENGHNHLEFAVWPLVLGFAAEAAKRRFRLSRALLRIGVAAGVTGLVVALVLISGRFRSENLAVMLGTGVLPACFLCYQGNLVLDGPLGRLSAWLGKRTYSIYLWQEPLTLCGYLPDLLRPLGALVAIPLGALSYAWLEKPFSSTIHRRPAPAPEGTAAAAAPAPLAPCTGQQP